VESNNHDVAMNSATLLVKSNFYLTGFTGSGKTTLGLLLAEFLNRDFVDLDVLIESRFSKPVAVVFYEQGEETYRNIEAELLAEIATKTNQVVALGAGTITNAKNMEIIESTGVLIYLETSVQEVYNRISRSEKRMFFENPPGIESISEDELLRRIEWLTEVRRPFYEKAEIKIVTSQREIREIFRELIFVLQKHGLIWR